MRLLTVIFMILMLGLGAEAAAFEKRVEGRNALAVVSSEKPVVVGVNTLKIQLYKNKKEVNGTVKVKVFMPAMPGMPYMEDVAEAKALGNGMYEVDVALSMGGTWQMHIFVTPENGKKYRLKSTLNL